ncbi:MAG: anaerobic glycerol-3-phosphate dehydrogenase subunit C [Thermogutta sp.]
MASGYLEQQRDRVYEDLSGLIRGKVLRDPAYLELFASDAGLFHIQPLVVVRPQSVAGVTACMQYCTDRRIPVHARGAGTGCAGESLGPGVVIDFSAYLRRISILDPRASRIRVQPGVTFDRLQAQLATYRRTLPWKGGHLGVSTLGGTFSRCHRGAASPRYGCLSDWIREVTLCLADGTVLHLGRESLSEHASEPALSVNSRLVNEVAKSLNQFKDLPDQVNKERNGCGYNLADVLNGGYVDFGKLLAGSEGTLALILDMTFETVPLAPSRSVALLLFSRLDPAFAAAIEILRFRPTICDLMDRRHLSLARESDSQLEQLIPEHAEAAVLVQLDGHDSRETYNELRTILDSLRNHHHFDFSIRWAASESEMATLWRLARVTQPVVRRANYRFRPLPVADDLFIPPEKMAACVAQLQGILRQEELAGSIYCHVGHGVIHLQPFFDMQDPQLLGKMKRLADEVYGYVLGCHGGIGPTRGCGLSRTPYMRQQWGEVYPIFVRLKRTFDPLNILNPGKLIEGDFAEEICQPVQGRIFIGFPGIASRVVPGDESQDASVTGKTRLQPTAIYGESSAGDIAEDDQGGRFADRRANSDVPGRSQPDVPGEVGLPPPAEVSVRSLFTISAQQPKGAENEDYSDDAEPLPRILETQLDWRPDLVADAVAKCTGCGDCRVHDSQIRMCPLFRVLPVEESSPRSKATLMRAVLTQTLPLQSLTLEDFRAICDLCVHCHSCRIECPAGVDIPFLVSEAKAAYTSAHGSNFSDWLLNRIDFLAGLASRFAPLVNWGLANRQTRWLLEKLTGISHVRKLPRLHVVSFLHRAVRRKLHRFHPRSERTVVYFVDVFANWFDPALAEALVAVLSHQGISVFVPFQQRSAGTAAIASGDMNLARRNARANVAILAEAVRQGCDVITTEPAAALTLIQEYPKILGDEDSQLVAKHTHDAGEFLLWLFDNGQLRTDFQTLALRLGYHLPCRLRSLGVGQPGRELLELIPGVEVQDLPNGCSGMAGTFGIKAQNFRISLRTGWPIINSLRDRAIHAAVTECSMCRIQLEQGTRKPTLHPIKVLAAAYGLWPGGVQKLLQPGSSFLLA